ncbi:hypothetical protein WN51_03386 [Melipona quadrifasciata]|uniref:Uncharacterized protein n=1 Tax=Melipona quadrifasciata TaxID=166423 RepID=A0A0M8ZU29_9HYME|nr:hypothetical protein WN51_03386 [Melipona quadrifasciata]
MGPMVVVKVGQTGQQQSDQGPGQRMKGRQKDEGSQVVGVMQEIKLKATEISPLMELTKIGGINSSNCQMSNSENHIMPDSAVTKISQCIGLSGKFAPIQYLTNGGNENLGDKDEQKVACATAVASEVYGTT